MLRRVEGVDGLVVKSGTRRLLIVLARFTRASERSANDQSINRAFVIRAARRKEREKRERDDGVERTIDDDRIMRSVMYRVTDRPID